MTDNPDDFPEDVDDPTDLEQPETPETTGPDAAEGDSQDPEATP